MKNLMEALKCSFLKRMTFMVAVLAVLLASSSCKHDKGGDGKPKPKKEEVTITFNKGDHVTTIEHNSVKVAKAISLKPSDVMAKVGNITYEDDYEFDKFCIDSKDGQTITDAKPLVVDKNTNVYVMAKKKATRLSQGLKT